MAALPKRIAIDDPAALLRALAAAPEGPFSLEDVDYAEIWGLTALGALGRRERMSKMNIQTGPGTSASRFAHAIGFDDLLSGVEPAIPGEEGRTVKLRRILQPRQIERLADRISRMLVRGDPLEDTRRAVYYVVVELLRNAVQHSHDPLGGVVAAQRSDRGRDEERPTIQVAVADAGVGIPEHLRSQHPKLSDPEEALDKSLWPHISGTFEEGLTGTAENAGMGLFFIAEMAKLLAGQLVIATRGATLVLKGDPSGEEKHSMRFLQPKGIGFPGTLVAFELPEGEVQDFDALIETIKERAKSRTPGRAIHRWIRFEAAPSDAQRFIVKQAVENTSAAVDYARARLVPRLLEKKPIVLDFMGIPVCTQSFLHALLYEPLRIAWAMRTGIYVSNVQPAVKSNLELLENYALGG